MFVQTILFVSPFCKYNTSKAMENNQWPSHRLGQKQNMTSCQRIYAILMPSYGLTGLSLVHLTLSQKLPHTVQLYANLCPCVFSTFWKNNTYKFMVKNWYPKRSYMAWHTERISRTILYQQHSLSHFCKNNVQSSWKITSDLYWHYISNGALLACKLLRSKAKYDLYLCQRIYNMLVPSSRLIWTKLSPFCTFSKTASHSPSVCKSMPLGIFYIRQERYIKIHG